jgi:hypothetical protein
MGRSLGKPNPGNVYIDRGLHACPTQKTKFLSFQSICWKGHVTWIGPFLFLGKGMVKCQIFHGWNSSTFNSYKFLCPDLHLLVGNLDIYFSQTYILWRCKALGKIPLVFIFRGHLICMNVPPTKEEGGYSLRVGGILHPITKDVVTFIIKHMIIPPTLRKPSSSYTL